MKVWYNIHMTEEATIAELASSFSNRLQELDVYVVDYNLFVYDVNQKRYKDFEELRKDIIAGRAKVFFTVEAFLGEDVWNFMDEEE